MIEERRMNLSGTLLLGFIMATIWTFRVEASNCHYYGAYFDNTLDEDFNLESVEECVEACQGVKKCRYWTYDTLTGNCQKKHAYNGEPLLRPHLDMISGPRNCYGYDNKDGNSGDKTDFNSQKKKDRRKNIIY